MRIARKVLFRLFRIMTFKKGVYGSIGKKNKFTTGVFVEEAASIGKYNYFGPYSMINHAIIGNYCSIGPGVKMGQGKHSISYVTTYQSISSSLIGHSLNEEPTQIGNDVWCGANVVIMQGVKIGDGAVIGANAVVTKDIPEYAIAVGIPARVISYRFNEEDVKKIKESQWFYKDIDKAKDSIRQLEFNPKN
ncbi:CatB-related O-acetyltransferase [Priestia megaterium]